MPELTQPHEMAQSILTTALGHDAGPLKLVESQSSQVFVGWDVVVKLAEHSRLKREVRLAASLPSGLAPNLLASGTRTFDGRFVHFACYRRAAGTTPGAGLPGLDAAAARSLAERAVKWLEVLHSWRPPDDVVQLLRQPLNHGGFTAGASSSA